MIMILRMKASTKMKSSPYQISQYTGDQIDPINGERLRRLKIGGVKSSKNNAQNQQEDRIPRQSNEYFITTTFKSKAKSDWQWTNRGLRVGDKVRAIQALSCTLPTKVNKRRGNPHMSIKQYKCRNGTEDDSHILNNCEIKTLAIGLAVTEARHNKDQRIE